MPNPFDSIMQHASDAWRATSNGLKDDTDALYYKQTGKISPDARILQGVPPMMGQLSGAVALGLGMGSMAKNAWDYVTHPPQADSVTPLQSPQKRQSSWDAMKSQFFNYLQQK